MTQLALFGGEKAVTIDSKTLRTTFSEQELDKIVSKLKEGILYTLNGAGILKEFEDRVSSIFNRRYALAVTNGTTAINTALFAIGVGPGDEVVAPVYGYPGAIYTILQQGATPIFCEVYPDSLNLDPEDAKKKITNRTKAIIVTNMAGFPGSLKEIKDLADKHSLPLIVDASRAFGAQDKDLKWGETGKVGCFSLNIHKALGVGEGGILVTNDKEVYDRAIILGQPVNFNVKESEYSPFIETALGTKHKMHPISAALGLLQLEKLEDRITQSNLNFQYLQQRLAEFEFLEPFGIPHDSKRGGWSGYYIRYNSDKLEMLSINTFTKALRAEGARLVREYSSNLVHTNAAYQQSEMFNRSVLTGKKATIGDYPRTESLVQRLLIIENVCSYAVDSSDLVDQYVVAIRKVRDNVMELRGIEE